MADEATQDTATEAVEQDQNIADQSTAGDDAETPGAEALGDPGKKALDSMKAERNQARQEKRDLEQRLAELQAKVDGREAEHQAEQERRAVEVAALDKANQRILRAEFKTAAKGVLNDPEDVHRYIDISDFEVDDDGNVNDRAIADAVADLVKSKPYLAVAQGARFQGSADQGARKAETKSEEQQLEEGLKTASPAERIAIRQRLAAIKAEANR